MNFYATHILFSTAMPSWEKDARRKILASSMDGRRARI